MATRYLIAPITHALGGCDVYAGTYPLSCDRPATWRVWALVNIAPPGQPPDEGGPIFCVCDRHIGQYASQAEQQRVLKEGRSPEWDEAQAISVDEEG